MFVNIIRHVQNKFVFFMFFKTCSYVVDFFQLSLHHQSPSIFRSLKHFRNFFGLFIWTSEKPLTTSRYHADIHINIFQGTDPRTKFLVRKISKMIQSINTTVCDCVLLLLSVQESQNTS